MIVSASERKTTIRENVKGGPGILVCLDCIGKNGKISTEDTLGKIGTLTEMMIPVGYGIGKHIHTEDAELFYVMDGELTIVDDDQEYVLHRGNLNYCCCGGSHELINKGKEAVTVLCAVIK